jgi:hypothetical protein
MWMRSLSPMSELVSPMLVKEKNPQEEETEVNQEEEGQNPRVEGNPNTQQNQERLHTQEKKMKKI